MQPKQALARDGANKAWSRVRGAPRQDGAGQLHVLGERTPTVPYPGQARCRAGARAHRDRMGSVSSTFSAKVREES